MYYFLLRIFNLYFLDVEGKIAKIGELEVFFAQNFLYAYNIGWIGVMDSFLKDIRKQDHSLFTI